MNKLERCGLEILEKMEFECFGDLGQVRIAEAFPQAAVSPDDHFEFDYFILCGNKCLIGEMSGIGNEDKIKRRFRKFAHHFQFLHTANDTSFFKCFNISRQQLHKFDEVASFQAFFIAHEHERYDLELDQIENIAVIYKEDWETIKSYADFMGKYASYPFLKLINVIDQSDKGTDLRFEIEKSKLMRVPHKLIASGIETTRADVFVFETHPAKLLNIAEVFRRELMPIVAFSNGAHYQRRLDIKKLQQMHSLVIKSDFMFPGSILVALSEKCQYIEHQRKLVIPEEYGSISVIDGQHRLFSYANRELPDKVREDATILVTALLFKTKNPEQVLHCSAKTFIEINSKQKRISSDHIIEIAYKVLGDQGKKALAAQVILDCNQRKGKALYGMFSSSQTSKGIYKSATVIVHLAGLTNLDAIKRLIKADTKEKAKAKNSYEILFDRPIQELQDAEVLIKQSVICLEHFFSYVKRIFKQDWIDCETSKKSMTMHKTSLAYTKVFCGFIILLREFIKDGLDWAKIEKELETIRSNILEMRRLPPDDPGIVLALGVSEIPDDRYPPSDTFQFLNKNRRQPTSIQKINQTEDSQQ